MSTDARRLAVLGAAAAPFLFALPVFAAISLSLARLLGTAHPDFGIFPSATSDGHALELGQPLYQDTDQGYTGTLYTPGVPVVLSLLYRIDSWNGWPALLVILASVALVAMVARLAYAPERESALDRAAGLAGAVGLGALAWWLVNVLQVDLLYSGRVDQVAWAFALGGLLATARAAPGSTRAELVAALLFTAAIWSKQSTAPAAAVAIVWAAGLAFRGRASWRFPLRLAGAVVALNLVLFGLANLLTSGWEWFFNFELPNHHPIVDGATAFVGELLRGIGPALVLAAIAWVALLLTRTVRDRLDPLAGLLALFVVVDVALALYFRRKAGGEDNQYIGIVWALAMLAAIAYRQSRGRLLPRLATGAAVAGLFALAAIAPVRDALGRHRVNIPGLRLAISGWPEPPAPLRDYARSHLVYHSAWSELNVENRHVLYTGFYNYMDLLAGGEQPRYLVQALLDRRFDAVAPLPENPTIRKYSSGYGKWEENYIWKLNRVIRARYRPPVASQVPAGLLVRDPGPERGRWMRSCFGPFDLGGASFRIHLGGGFWCRAGRALRLVDTPAPLSEVVTSGPVPDARGSMAVTLPRAGLVSIEMGETKLVLGRRGGRRLLARFVTDGKPGAATVVRSRRALVRFSPDGVAVGGATAPLDRGHELTLAASRGSGAAFDMSALALRRE